MWTNYKRDCSIVAMDKFWFTSDDNYLHNPQIIKPENDSLEIFNRSIL